MRGAIYIQRSKNTKLGNCDATYTSIKATCSSSCSLKKNGCYAESSFVGMVNHRLNKRARQFTPLQVARAEAKCIDQAYKSDKVPARHLRLHVSGDARTITAVKTINRAVGRWKNRGGKNCWTYTHSWKHVPRSEWSNVSILASIESVSQVAEVRKQGYAPALIVSQFTDDRAFRLAGSSTLFIPCPAQTKKHVSCESCQLCSRSRWLFETNRGIAFAAHGINKDKTKRHLQVINQ